MKYVFWPFLLGIVVYVFVWIFGPGEGMPSLTSGTPLESTVSGSSPANDNLATEVGKRLTFYQRLMALLGSEGATDEDFKEFLESEVAEPVQVVPSKPALPNSSLGLQFQNPGLSLDPGEREKFCEGVASRKEIRGFAKAVSAGLLVVTEKATGCEVPVSLEGIVYPSYEQSCIDGYRCGEQGTRWMSGILAQDGSTELGELVCRKSSKRVGLLGSASAEDAIQTIGLLRQPTPCENNRFSEWTQIWVPVMQCSSWKSGDLSELLVKEGWAEAQDPSYLKSELLAKASGASNLWSHGGMQDPGSWSLDFANRQREARRQCLQ